MYNLIIEGQELVCVFLVTKDAFFGVFSVLWSVWAVLVHGTEHAFVLWPVCQ